MTKMPEAAGGKPIGLFGGTFDPVHFGHLRLAEEAAEHLGLARIRWLPAGRPGHREAPRVTSAQRLEMVRLAIAGNPRFELDASEVEADRPSYTVPTLERLRQLENFGASQPLVLLVGADAFAGLPDWHRWPALLDLAHIAVAHRPGFPIDAASLPPALAAIYRQRFNASPAVLADTSAGCIVTFAMTQLDISATKIRTLLVNGRSPRYLLPDAVIAYIQGTRLYSPP
jgi:nicotinate-nucleotide adenylyltransferase